MNISEKLQELGMHELPRDRTINGFDEVVTFVLPDYVQKILEERCNATHTPDIVIIRGGRVKNKGKSIKRKNPKEKIRYSLAYYDEENEIFRIVSNEQSKKVRGILGNMTEYVTGEGALLSAKKYLEEHKIAQN